jgi:23S rRNA (adenine2503-C2)-methyltransferase
MAQPQSPSLLDLNNEELAQAVAERNLPKFRAGQILQWVYRQRVSSWEQMTNLPAELRQNLSAEIPLILPQVLREQGSADTTRKFLFELSGGDRIESVLIPASPALYGGPSDRRTLCLSSQVGCAYGCKFCASGLDGWKRNLSAGEIVGQFLAVEAITGEKINNLVFMGMGEPLANYDSLLRAIEIFNADWGLGLGARHMTLSTSGLVPRIYDLARQPKQVRLAISLHGATDEVREKIMPVNRRYPLAELMDACLEYTRLKKQYLTFEYILIEGVNSDLTHARDLARLCRRLRSKVNLIPYNRVEGLPWERPSEPAQDAFLAILTQAGIPATLRREKGHDIAAACGQLRLQSLKTDPPPAVSTPPA